MGRYILARLTQALLVLLGAAVVVFTLLQVAGDPVVIMMSGTAISENELQALRRELGLDAPAAVRLVRFLGGLVRGDLGPSLRSGRPALELVLERMPATLLLTGAALTVSLAVAVPVGIVSAVRPNGFLDLLGRTLAVVGQATPVFWLGIMMILVFAVELRWLPAGGYGTWAHLVMPAAVLGLYPMARIARLLRSSLLEVIRQDYIRTARAKGLAEPRIVSRHALRNAAIPVVTVVGLTFGGLIGGAVVTETIFAWPGVGQLAVQAIYNRDANVVQAAVLVGALAFTLVNLLVDVLYAALDPRVRY
ncbi:MAG: ABC transporter permease [Armatimonadota bacterium]|nr:ABC transporter permease [Armatimonadota bacterium]MDR7488523.1 ABC transporter permease [Armatimonadota bacterium]MDR7573786.1 ABC transporter permease [Armatimonadota bacterium]MDR7586533.1 ABC transporter permease [Armatimonadota bacterium]